MSASSPCLLLSRTELRDTDTGKYDYSQERQQEDDDERAGETERYRLVLT